MTRTGGTPIEKKKIAILALGAASLATLGKVGTGDSWTPADPAASVVTRCAYSEKNSVDGFVSNQGTRPLRLRGEIRFTFSSGGGAPSRADLYVHSDVELPPGKPVQVAHFRLDPPQWQGEQCRLDVANAIQGGR